MRSIEYIIERIDLLELVFENNQYKVASENKYFAIGNVLGELICLLHSKISFDKASLEIQQKHYPSATVSEVYKNLQEALSHLFDKIMEEPTNENSRKKYIFFQKELLNTNHVNMITSALHHFYNPIAICVFIFSIVLTHCIYFSDYTKHSWSNSTPTEFIITYFSLFIIFLFHELGHASATKYFGLNPHKIGIGFYLVIPVFFADVSEVWKVNKYKRIVVNLGGIYFQLIINTFLILFYFYSIEYYLSFFSELLKMLIYTNIFICLYSLIPFLRNDGYWIYSDLFELPNLMQKSFRFPIDLWNEFSVNSNIKSIVKYLREHLPLSIYSFANYSFIIYFGFRYIGYMYSQFTEILYYYPYLFANTELLLYSLNQMKGNIFHLGVFVVVVYRFRNIIFSISKFILSWFNHLSKMIWKI